MELPKTLQLDDEGEICDERGILVPYSIPFVEAMVARYNAHAAREQVLADVADLVTQLWRVLPDYHKSRALVVQIQATLKKARE